MSNITTEGGLALAPPGIRTLVRIVAAGAAGLVVWEGFARLIAPAVFGFTPEPTGLIELAFGLAGMAAMLLHIATGLVAFPAGYVLVVQPVLRAIAPGLPWIAVGVAYGVALWVFAMYGMASLLGGMPPFMGFEPIAWASLIGHVGLALGIALVAARMPGDAP